MQHLLLREDHGKETNMADEASEDGEYVFCALCRKNHNLGRKHIYSKKHKSNLDNVLKKFLRKVSEVRKFLRKPCVEDGELEPGAKFWCHFCSTNVAKHVTDRDITIAYGGLFEHFASKDHHSKTHKFWWQHGADKNLKNKFLVDKEEFSKYKEKVENLLKDYEEQLEEKQKKEVARIKATEMKQAKSSQQPPLAQPPAAVVYRTVHNELGILQNPTGWDDGYRVWGGGIVKYREGSDQWFPWELDLDDGFAKKAGPSTPSVTGFQTVSALGENLTFIGMQELKEGEGNIHTGATPPWLRDDDDDDEGNEIQKTRKSDTVEIGPSLEEFKKRAERVKKEAKNPNRVGANFDRGKATNDEWLPSYGGVWNSGPRWQSRHEFRRGFKKNLFGKRNNRK